MIYEYWLAGIKEITDLKKQKLREVYGSGKAIYYIEETKLDKLRFLNEKDVAILKNAKKDTKLEEKWRRTEEKRNKTVKNSCKLETNAVYCTYRVAKKKFSNEDTMGCWKGGYYRPVSFRPHGWRFYEKWRGTPVRGLRRGEVRPFRF